MKIFFLFAFLFLTMNITAFAQSLSFELDKIRQIKMLESTRDDIKRILLGYKSDDENDESDFSQTFSSEKMEVEISYTTGDCSDKAAEMDEWNIPKGKVKLIEITFTDSVTLEDLQLDLSDFKKEQKYSNVKDEFAYYTMDLGIVIYVTASEVKTFLIFPALKKSSLLCKNRKNEDAKKLRKGYSIKSFFLFPKLEDRIKGGPANVTELTLSEYEIAVSCLSVDSEQTKNCSNSPRIVSVSTTASDPENDQFVYRYSVSGGKIIGTGKDVMWDLTGVKPGKYTIAAGVDDGCGICGETKTKEVIVK